MGHLSHLREEYRELVTRLNAGHVGMPEPETATAREGWQDILEILYTPDEAWLGARLPLMPATVHAIAHRVGLAEEALMPRLEAMADKGIVMDLVDPDTGRTFYMLSPPVVGFFEFSMMRHDDLIPKRRMAEALDAYTHGDDTFVREVFGGDTVIGRAMAHETALGDAIVPEVLDWERATAAIRDASSIAVQTCYCRHKAAHLGKQCDAPIETCMSLNEGADFVVRHELGRPVEKAEALEILSQSRERGLVQIADNVRERPTYLCNCCGCCCGQLQPINDYGMSAVNPSSFRPTFHLEHCKGCSRCARACQIAAISMVPHRVAAKRRNDLTPHVDTGRCIGCGVCADTCRNDAIVMERPAEPPYVPLNTMERVVRMALERGKLAHLLFDTGAGRGSRFMNAVMRALCALPPVERALASEQVRSRFVRYALRTAHGAMAAR